MEAAAEARLMSKAEGPDLSRFWMPFTANRRFKSAPRLLESAEGLYYRTTDGRAVLDGTAGLWCCNAGHADPRIVEAIAAQACKLDFAPTFQLGHSLAFDLSDRLIDMAPAGIDHAFFCNSGSEAVDTALKIALAYHRARNDASRIRLIGRERGYHGVGFGGMAVGGIGSNRRAFGPLLGGVDHICSTHLPDRNILTRGMPEYGAELADDLERLVTLHDASTIAAVIVEPVACSTGVLVPPRNYLQRLRAICDRHGILLIFDEVITAFGRVGAPFAADRFGVTPDIITTAKAITNGAVPMGCVLTCGKIYDSITAAAAAGAIELAHGYTYSAHPLACAAAMATLDVYEQDGLFDRSLSLESHWEAALHRLADSRHVLDIRNFGMIGAIELQSRPDAPGQRAFEVFQRCFEQGVLIRVTGDIIALSPPLTISLAQIDQLFDTITKTLARTA